MMGIVYDGDGNRVSETAGGVTTTYFIDTLNPTGDGHGNVRFLTNSAGTVMGCSASRLDSSWDSNPYAYADDNPVNLVDPLGQDAVYRSQGYKATTCSQCIPPVSRSSPSRPPAL
jgi:hypothetical protein